MADENVNVEDEETAADEPASEEEQEVVYVDQEPEFTGGRSFAVEGNDTEGYVGVAPEYMTYANETDKPYTAPEDVEKVLIQEDREVQVTPPPGEVVVEEETGTQDTSQDDNSTEEPTDTDADNRPRFGNF